MNNKYASLIQTVQHNCHIADARHAGDYTLCVYLLKMREFYRWEQAYNYQKVLTNDDVGDWLVEREGLWDDIEQQEFKPLLIDGIEYDPFDADKINQVLNKAGLIYSAGFGNQCRPHFFLGQLEEKIQKNDIDILIAAKEYARDMASPAAMQQGETIYIRRESLRQVLWEKVEEWRWIGVDSPLARAVAHYDFDNDIEIALDEMTAKEIHMVIAHEIGEVIVGRDLGEQWQKMLNTLPRSKAEIMLRAIRDHYADAITSLPKLVEDNNAASIHFYFGNMTAMRKKLAPQLLEWYETWRKDNNLSSLEKLIPLAEKHWQNISKKALALYVSQGKEAVRDIESLVDANYF